MNIIYREIIEEVNTLPVVDTHEHLMPEKQRLENKVDFFNVFLTHYASSDIISAGMSSAEMESLQSADADFNKKIGIFMPFWKKASNTAYCRAIKIAVKDLYDIDIIDETTLPHINKSLLEQNKPGFYDKILKDKLNIKYCVWDQWWEAKPKKDSFFRVAIRLDDIMYIKDPSDIEKLEAKFKFNISSVSDIEDILEVVITNNKYTGLVALKTGLAYDRTLDYQPASRVEATLALEKILRGRFTDTDAKTVQDYLMFSLAQKAYWHNLPLQIHTGHQEGNGNYISNSNPSKLSSLILENPNTKFDLFHGGYPYGGELSSLAKMFPNVYVDMSWLHVISPEYSKRYLSEWLDTVPVNKILGFGGDYIFVEGVYGHLIMAKQNISQVLASKVEDGIYTISEAKQYARMILCDNADYLFSQI